MNTKRLISSILTIVLCVSMIAGSTFALFTSKDSVDVSVKAAKVNITANVENIALSSMGVASADGKTFANGGTAEYDPESGKFTLTSVAPGDKVTFDIKVTNNSDIAIQYRVKWTVEGGLLGALVATVDDVALKSVVSEWSAWSTTDSATKTLRVSLELPVEADDTFQEKSATVAFVVEAVQGNGVAYLPGEQYASSEEGLRAAFANGGDIVLNNNIALENGSLVVPAGKTVNLDLNGCVISADSSDPTVLVEAGGVLNTKDSAASGVATFARRTFAMTRGGINNDNGNAIKNNGTVTLTGGQYTSGKGYALNNESSDSKLTATNIVGGGAFNAGELELNNCELLNEVSGRHTVYNSGTLTVNGGIYENTSANEVIKSPSVVAAVINSGSFIMTGKSYLLGGNIIINGGNFAAYDNGDGTTDKMRPNSANDSINVNGGSFNFDVTGWIETNEIMEENNGEYTVVNGLLYFADRNEYQLSSVEALIWFADEVNQYSNYEHPFEGETVKLMSDIDLEGMEWTPIGDYRFQANRFCGTFDGQGNTISNFQISKKTDKNDSNKSSYGFFGNVDGTVKNLTIDNASVKSYAYVGALIGRLNGGTVENCHVTNSKVECTYWQAGGMIGQLNDGCTVKDCSITGTTVTGASAIGGMFGPLTAANKEGTDLLLFENCSVKNCAVVQNGSFGGSYDAMFGAMFADIDVLDNETNINGCSAENTTVKGESTAALFNTLSGSKVYFDGYSFVSDGLYKNGVTYRVYNANGLETLNAMMADKTAGRDTVVTLMSDIDFTGKTWTPVDSHADTAFEIAEINGNGYTISNLTVNGQAMFKRFAGSGDVVIKDITFDNAVVNSNAINSSILTVHSYQNVLLDNVDVKNSTITGGYKVAPLIATVYNENSSTTVTAILKNCDVSNTTVKATSYDFCTTGMVAFVYADDNDKIEFENCTVSDVTIIAPDDSYDAHAWIYTTGSETLFNEADGVTVTNCRFETLK